MAKRSFSESVASESSSSTDPTDIPPSKKPKDSEIMSTKLRTQPGHEDKVLVSIRIRPTDSPSVWDTTNKNIKLYPQLGKSAQEFLFDEILTGSENKPVYDAVARSHVCAAMDGYDAVIFVYGQTASGKTFTLTSDADQPGIIPRWNGTTQ